jgi:hypothetical protein
MSAKGDNVTRIISRKGNLIINENTRLSSF